MLADLAPKFLYAGAAAAVGAPLAPTAPLAPPRGFAAASPMEKSASALPAFPLAAAAAMTAAAPAEKVELYSPKFYQICAVGGALCCGGTHTAVTPLDVVKCNMQVSVRRGVEERKRAPRARARLPPLQERREGLAATGARAAGRAPLLSPPPPLSSPSQFQTNPAKYPSIGAGFSITASEGGMRGLVRGWVPTLFGYSIQGAAKFGLYGTTKKEEGGGGGGQPVWGSRA